MTNPKPAVSAEEQGFALYWGEAPDLQQVLADEAFIQFAADRVYLTLGQVQVPPNPSSERAPKSLEIAPLARFVFTVASFQKLVNAMKSVSESIKKSPEATGGSG
jgi:hypothetical protein